MERTIKLEGHEIGFKASAGTVRTYRMTFGRDMILDIGKFEEEIFQTKCLSKDTAEIAENVIWLMAKEYDDSIPDIRTWLDMFSPYLIYEAIPHTVVMWRDNIATSNKSKKK